MALPRSDEFVLGRVFALDPELQTDVGVVLFGFVELGLQGVFVREFVSLVRASGPRVPPALAVLPAASAAMEAVTCRR